MLKSKFFEFTVCEIISRLFQTVPILYKNPVLVPEDVSRSQVEQDKN